MFRIWLISNLIKHSTKLLNLAYKSAETKFHFPVQSLKSCFSLCKFHSDKFRSNEVLIGIITGESRDTMHTFVVKLKAQNHFCINHWKCFIRIIPAPRFNRWKLNRQKIMVIKQVRHSLGLSFTDLYSSYSARYSCELTALFMRQLTM